mmetsp:Transcript_22058/g.67749  ORF Transcript_22058/g.67749 Transcript_22058/m.67749 type:complete len:91 (-) Transcript_22058:69-341(-)
MPALHGEANPSRNPKPKPDPNANPYADPSPNPNRGATPWPVPEFAAEWDATLPAVHWEEPFAPGAPRQVNPILDIVQGQHDALYSRLFLS